MATEAAQNPAHLAQNDDPQLDELLAHWDAMEASARQDLLSVARGLQSRQAKP